MFPDPCWRSKELTSESLAGLTAVHVFAPPALNAKPALVERLCCSWELPCDVVQGHLCERVRETHALQPLLLGGLLTVCKSMYSLSLSRKFIAASSGLSLGAGWAQSVNTGSSNPRSDSVDFYRRANDSVKEEFKSLFEAVKFRSDSAAILIQARSKSCPPFYQYEQQECALCPMWH